MMCAEINNAEQKVLRRGKSKLVMLLYAAAVLAALPALAALTACAASGNADDKQEPPPQQTAPPPSDPTPDVIIERAGIEGTYLDIAQRGVYDMLSNYWDPAERAILTTWNGYPADWPDPDIVDPRGAVWPRAMFMMPALALAQLTGDSELFSIVETEWETIKSIFSRRELSLPIPIINTCVDDCGWNAFAYMRFYEAFGDEAALEISAELMERVFDKWYDEEWGGPSLWYRDARDFKSLYQVGVLLTCFDLYEATGDEGWWMLAKTCYDTLESILLRDDDIYFSDYNASGPMGKERPNDIREAGSVSFLGGNMAMAVLHARLFRITGDDVYLDRALRTVRGIRNVLTVDGGVLLNERDAWATGTFTPQYAAEVLTLPGISENDKTVLYNTAASIAANARTDDGFYGGSWSGPADGPGSAWYRIGSKPQQIMTSGNSVLVLVGAAVLENAEKGGGTK